MSEKKIELITGGSAEQTADDPVELAAKAAEAMEKAASLESNVGSYVHKFKKPFSYQGQTFEELSFDWDSLTGGDSLAIENEMRAHGVTLVLPAYTGEYLAGMAARACTARNEAGKRVIGTDAIRAMSLGDFQKICGRARTFLLRAGS